MVHEYYRDFPILSNRRENGKRLTYLDNAATTQKPESVIAAVDEYYRYKVANPYRGAYTMSAEATELCENTRKKAADFIHAGNKREIVFTQNTTEAMNLLALSLESQIEEGDEILISVSEHHSNLLPWQRLAQKKGARLCYLYLTESGMISLDEVRNKVNVRTKIVSVTHISNVLGAENPIKEIASIAHQAGAVVIVDGAQSVPHIPVDVQELDVDAMVFSGHKMLAPNGVGILYGKLSFLESLEPVKLGGGIVSEVTEQSVRLLDVPNRFEPGTPNVEGIIGLSAAMDYITRVGFDEIRRVEGELTTYLLEEMSRIPNIIIYGSKSARERCGIVSFQVKDVHPHDAASILNADGIAIRAGHHCAQPLMTYLGIQSCCRVSLYFYNTKEDIDIFLDSLKQVRRWLGYGSE